VIWSNKIWETTAHIAAMYALPSHHEGVMHIFYNPVDFKKSLESTKISHGIQRCYHTIICGSHVEQANPVCDHVVHDHMCCHDPPYRLLILELIRLQTVHEPQMLGKLQCPSSLLVEHWINSIFSKFELLILSWQWWTMRDMCSSWSLCSNWSCKHKRYLREIVVIVWLWHAKVECIIDVY
jgi:hypothetical protein